MKKLLCLIAFILALACAFASCGSEDPNITINEDGYVVVNGVKTEHLVEKADAVHVEDGYLVVNGIKTEYKVEQEAKECTHNFDANGICNMCNVANPNRIEYSLSLGTKIDTLSISEQEMIDTYVEDCKTLYKIGYAASTVFDPHVDVVPYLSFTDVIVYDFRDVDENTLDKISLMLWNNIKKSHAESNPMLYIELAGYHAYFNSDLLTPIQSGSIIYGFFIFEDDTVIRQTYNRLCSTAYVYKLFEGTTVINCGNKYFEEFNGQQFNAWINSAGEYKSLQDMMQKLRVDE